MAQRFTWDERKAAANRRKHGISFEEALTAFADPLGMVVQDAVEPARTILVGLSATERLLVVIHAEQADTTIRIISARRATSHERRRYEEGA